MRTFIAAILLAAFCFPAEAAFRDEAFLTVRPVAGGPTNNDIFCSAVVVEPGLAYTAAHCVSDGGAVMVDGRPVTRTTLINGTDAAVVVVPGLACPCAKVDAKPAQRGEIARAVGYPGLRNDGKPIERHATGPMTVLGTGVITEFYPGSFAMGPLAMPFLYMTPGLVENGQSGGGTFVHRGGRWVLVGTNSVGICPPGKTYCTQAQEIASGSTPVATHQK